MRTWTFTTDEFAHVWQSETGTDRCPFPITTRSATRDQDEHAALAAAAARRWPTGRDGHLTAALRQAARPDVEVVAFQTAGDPVRVHGARVGDRGVVLRQSPEGDVEVYAGTARMVTRALATFLGDRPEGGAGPLVEDIDRMAAQFESWHRPPESVTERVFRLSRAPRTSAGYIEVRTGLHEHPEAPARYLGWFDVAGDGRYLHYRSYQDLHIEPVDKERLVVAVDRLIGG